MPSANAMIEAHGVTKRLPSGDRELTVLEAVDLSIAAGEFLVEFGAEAAGHDHVGEQQVDPIFGHIEQPPGLRCPAGAEHVTAEVAKRAFDDLAYRDLVLDQ